MPSAALHVLQAVVAGGAAAALEADHAQRQVDLVVHDHEPLRRHLVEGAGALHRPARLVHVRHRDRERQRRVARADVGDQHPRLVRLEAGAQPRRRATARCRRRGCGGCRRTRASGLAEADRDPAVHQRVLDRGPGPPPARQQLRHVRLLAPSASAASAAVAPSASSSASAAASGASSTVGVVTWMTTASGSVSSVTPEGRVISPALDRVADGQRAHVDRDGGRAPRAAAPRSRRVCSTWRQHAALDHAGGIALDVQRHVDGHRLEAVDRDEVDVQDVASHGVALDLARQREVLLAVDVEVEHRVLARRGVQHVVERERVDGHGGRLAARRRRRSRGRGRRGAACWPRPCRLPGRSSARSAICSAMVGTLLKVSVVGRRAQQARALTQDGRVAV